MFFELAMQRKVVVRGLKIAALVGTLLIMINHADALIRGEIDLVIVIKMALTYAVPYCVSVYASVATLQHLGGGSTAEGGGGDN